VLAAGGSLIAYRRLTPDFRARNRVEGWTGGLLAACSVVAVLTTVGILASLVFESWRFFQVVSPLQFLFGTDWDPQIAMRADQFATHGAFGAVPLFVGTFLVMLIAMAVAAPVGLFSAIYLSEYARPATRAWVKPLLEILAGVPTVVYGFFRRPHRRAAVPRFLQCAGRQAGRRAAARDRRLPDAGAEPDGRWWPGR